MVMEKETHIINILTYRLPFDLSNQIFNEYENRLREVDWLLDKYKKYSPLKQDRHLIELFLCLSIFNKRVVSNLDAAIKFHGTVGRIGEVDSIRIGSYSLNSTEKNRLLGVVLSYQSILKKFGIPQDLMEYYETRELLIKLIDFKRKLKNDNKGEGPSKNIQDDLPF